MRRMECGPRMRLSFEVVAQKLRPHGIDLVSMQRLARVAHYRWGLAESAEAVDFGTCEFPREEIDLLCRFLAIKSRKQNTYVLFSPGDVSVKKAWECLFGNLPVPTLSTVDFDSLRSVDDQPLHESSGPKISFLYSDEECDNYPCSTDCILNSCKDLSVQPNWLEWMHGRFRALSALPGHVNSIDQHAEFSSCRRLTPVDDFICFRNWMDVVLGELLDYNKHGVHNMCSTDAYNAALASNLAKILEVLKHPRGFMNLRSATGARRTSPHVMPWASKYPFYKCDGGGTPLTYFDGDGFVFGSSFPGQRHPCLDSKIVLCQSC